MAVLPLVKAPDSRLKIKSFPVDDINQEILELLDDMVETMYAEGGIGLAAVQVGVHKRLLVMDLQEDEQKNPLYIINPEIIESSEELSSYEEGCLSFPGQKAKVVRPATVTVKYLDREGVEQFYKAEGLAATCIQHEIDHLNGVVFPDHISKLRRDMIMKRVKKYKKMDERNN
ncbi:MAG: peptide deformylase [Rickettsiales bacterium]|nr:peptide deformylase [Rickettsiales bacterium]